MTPTPMTTEREDETMTGGVNGAVTTGDQKAEGDSLGFEWRPSALLTTPEHEICDELVVGRIERFFADGPTYAIMGVSRLGPFPGDTAARRAVIAAFSGRGSPVAKSPSNEKVMVPDPTGFNAGVEAAHQPNAFDVARALDEAVGARFPTPSPVTEEVVIELARQICRAASDVSCVMDDHPERPPCNADNCRMVQIALKAIEDAKLPRAAPATSAPADHWPANLHPQTSSMVQRFSVALAKKLRLAEQKYGFADGWAKDDWENECRDHLYQHLDKGDPLDVAAYCAFMWHHRWHTHRASVSAPAGDGEAEQAADQIISEMHSLKLSEWDRQCLHAKIVAALRAQPPQQTGDPDIPNLSLCSFSYLADELRRRGATVTPAPHGGNYAD